MAEEPSNAELAWRLERIQDTLSGVVGRPEYTADQRGTDRRLAEMERDLAEERRERSEADKALHDRVTEQARTGAEHGQRWHDRLWIGVLPALVAAAGVAVTLWISHGGH